MTKEQFQAIKDQIYSICSQHGDVKIRDGIVQVRIGPFEWFDFTEPKHFNEGANEDPSLIEAVHACALNLKVASCTAETDAYFCTMPEGHSGDHVACTFGLHNLKSWPNTSNSEPNNNQGDV